MSKKDNDWFDPDEIKRHAKYLRVGRSKIDKAGRGVLARCDIPKGRWIGSMSGPNVGHNGKHVLWVESWAHEDLYDLVDIKGPLRYANHSADPNVELGGYAYAPRVFATKNIQRGEEISWDYCFTEEEKDQAFNDEYDTDLDWLSPFTLGLWLKENNAMGALDILVSTAELLRSSKEGASDKVNGDRTSSS